MRRSSITKTTIRDRAGAVTGIRWRARFWSPEGREVVRKFRTRREAQAWLDDQTAAKVTGQFIDPRDGRMTVAQYVTAWQARQIHRPSTAEKVRYWADHWVIPHLGDVPLAELVHGHVQSWVKLQTDTLAPSTVRVHHGMLAGMLNDAIADRKLASNPCASTKLPDEPQRSIIIPTDDAIVQIHDAITPRYAAAIHVAAGTGLRQGELLGLTVDQVDFLRREIIVDRQLILGGKGRNQFGPPKTSRSRRVIPVAQDIIDSIAAHLAEYGEGPDRVVFSSSYGGYVSKSTFNTALGKAVQASTDAPAGMTCHWLRHYYASRLIRFGESVKTVQARLGHATAAETLDTYGHLWADSDDRTREATAGILARGTTVERRAENGPI